MGTFISHSPAETQALGEAWGTVAGSGLVIGLCGDLGAGKTQLVKGLARGLGSPERVQSPTFALVNAYVGGRLTLFHLDLYRLETPEQIMNAGLEEYLNPRGVTVIEWADRWFKAPVASAACKAAQSLLKIPSFDDLPPTPRSFRWVVFEPLEETERRISYEDPGA